MVKLIWTFFVAFVEREYGEIIDELKNTLHGELKRNENKKRMNGEKGR